MSKRILLIPAAGVGERMKIGYPKQYYPLLDNTSMLEVTVNRLQDMHLFDQIAIVVSKNDSYIDQCHFHGDVCIFHCGGETRAESVLNGLVALNPTDDDWVFVHDAARPCLDRESVERLMEAIESEAIDGAILAMPVTDTIKWVGSCGLIEKTIDRSWRQVTDEASAMEAQNAKIRIVEGSAFNIKVTYPDDIEIVRNYLLNSEQKKD